MTPGEVETATEKARAEGIQFGVACVLRWLEICRKGNDARSIITINAHKSALLKRLLDGKEPLPVAPPLSFSYPWYDLIEDGYDEPLEVWKLSRPGEPDKIVINQHRWPLVRENAADDWVVSHTDGTLWRVWCVAAEGGPLGKKWRMERGGG